MPFSEITRACAVLRSELTTSALLERLIAAGTAPARKRMHARILLKADRGPGGPVWVDTAIAAAVEVSQPTIARVRGQLVEQFLAWPEQAGRQRYTGIEEIPAFADGGSFKKS